MLFATQLKECSEFRPVCAFMLQHFALCYHKKLIEPIFFAFLTDFETAEADRSKLELVLKKNELYSSIASCISFCPDFKQHLVTCRWYSLSHVLDVSILTVRSEAINHYREKFNFVFGFLKLLLDHVIFLFLTTRLFAAVALCSRKINFTYNSLY